MIFKLIFLTVITFEVYGQQYTPGSDEYILQALQPVLHPLDGLLFDGPTSATNALTTTPNNNKLPTLEQMRYYVYYAASMYYAYDHQDLSCEYCLKYKPDVYDHKVLVNDTHNTLALVTLSKNRKEIVVTFRGTWNIWNVLLDAIFINGREGESSEQIKIHQGFFIAVMSLYENVVRAIAEYLHENPGYKVVIVGHSLGAAMARATYFFLEDNKQFPGVEYELYTYGEPRVGNKYFADFMNSRSITTARIVARADLPAHMPPTSIVGTHLLGDFYIQPQTEFWINGEDDQKYCRQTFYEDPECSMSMGPSYSMVDHGVYFDTNIGSALGQPLLLTSLPLGLLNPVDDLPSLPKKLENLIGDLLTSGLIAPASG